VTGLEIQQLFDEDKHFGIRKTASECKIISHIRKPTNIIIYNKWLRSHVRKTKHRPSKKNLIYAYFITIKC